jgi:hypothetical protein
MRKNLLALSIAAMVGGLSGVANAQSLNSVGTLDLISFDPTAANAAQVVGSVPAVVANGFDFTGRVAAAQGNRKVANAGVGGIGGGHVLLVPYFTTQKTNHSLLNIVNTDTVNGKAVKLRYRGAANSDDLFDITIYLSPGDVWTADVAEENGYSRLFTQDNSCTLPTREQIRADNNGRFKVDRVRANDPKETREGYIEILNTADIPRFLPNGNPNPLYNAIKHNSSGVASCDPVVMADQANALVNIAGDRNSPALRGYSWPTGGLFANWSIVDVASTASFSGEATAVSAVRNVGGVLVNGAGRLVWAPQTNDVVSLASAQALTSDPLLSITRANGSQYIKSLSLDFPDLSTPYLPLATPAAQANALAQALEVLSVTNEYLTSSGVDFRTDWVFSMPTRRYAVGVAYGATPTAVFNPAVNRHFQVGNTSMDTAKAQLCVDTGNKRAYDREESIKTTFVISPTPAYTFCGETSVLTFNKQTSAESLLGAEIARASIQTGFGDGWFTINTPGVTGNGLPVLGFAAVKAAGNIGGTWEHRFER